jgi:hypothetical protein
MELGKCNPGPGESQPPNCPLPAGEMKCRKSDWSEWSTCSRPCEGGYQNRSRSFEPTTDTDETAGKCNTTLEELAACNNQQCDERGVNCEWHDWDDWSNCDPGTEQKSRKRAILRKPVYGIDCGGDVEEVVKCSTTCQPNLLHYCMWSTWSDWSTCSTTCGPEGRLNRKRTLVVTRETQASPAAR